MIEEKPEKFVKHVFPLSKSGARFLRGQKGHRSSITLVPSGRLPRWLMIHALEEVVVSLSALSAIATVNAQRGRNRAGPSHKRS